MHKNKSQTRNDVNPRRIKLSRHALWQRAWRQIIVFVLLHGKYRRYSWSGFLVSTSTSQSQRFLPGVILPGSEMMSSVCPAAEAKAPTRIRSFHRQRDLTNERSWRRGMKRRFSFEKILARRELLHAATYIILMHTIVWYICHIHREVDLPVTQTVQFNLRIV